jgi:hypothetical protein
MSRIFCNLYFVDAQNLFPAAVARYYKESIDPNPDRDPIFRPSLSLETWGEPVVDDRKFFRSGRVSKEAAEPQRAGGFLKP